MHWVLGSWLDWTLTSTTKMVMLLHMKLILIESMSQMITCMQVKLKT